MKENIEIIEDIIEHYIEADKCGLSNNDFKNEIKALSNILFDYKRVLKENEELKKERDAIYLDYQDLGKEKWKADEAILFLTERLENSIPKQKIKDKIEELEKLNIKDNESVKRFEEMRRNTDSDFYKKSYQISIHKLNAQIETRKHIISELQELLEEKGE